jgi:pseudoazurin
MFAKSAALAIAISATLAGAAWAETIEVKMLNKGEAGSMVFEPAYIVANPGDVSNFVSVDKGHNVQSIDGMLPTGVDEFKSAMSKDFALTVTAEGVYGVKCTPHYTMGMVALIKVGQPVNLEAASDVTQKGKAKQRFHDIFEKLEN